MPTLRERLTSFFWQPAKPNAPLPPERQLQEPTGVSGTPSFNGFLVSPEKNPALSANPVRQRTFDESIRNVSVIATGLRYFLTLVHKTSWKPQQNPDLPDHPDVERAAELITADMAQLETPWSDVVRKQCLFRFKGFSIQEWLTREDPVDGVIMMRRIDPRPQHTIEQWGIDPRTGEVTAFGQRDPMTGELIPIDRRRCIYAVDDDLTDSPEGVGLIRHALTDARIMGVYEKLEGIGFETDMRGIPVGYAPIRLLDEAVSRGDLTAAQRDAQLADFRTILENHVKNAKMALLLDSMPYTGLGAESMPSSMKQWYVELLRGDTSSNTPIGKAIDTRERRMARLLGVEHLMLAGSERGSHALSSDRSRSFTFVLQAVLGYLGGVFGRDYVRAKLILNNFDPNLPIVLRPQPVQMRDVEEITKALKDMADAGAVLLPDDPVNRDVRELLDVSPPPPIPELTTQDRTTLLGVPPPKPEPMPGGGGFGGNGSSKPKNGGGATSSKDDVIKLFQGVDWLSIEKILRQEGGKWHVYSHDGSKHLGGPYDSKDEAVERLRQVEGHKKAALAPSEVDLYAQFMQAIAMDPAAISPLDVEASKRIAKSEKGVFVGIFPPENVARVLSMTGGADTTALHVTLAYLGKGLPEIDVARAVALVRRLVRHFAPFRVQVTGHAVFRSPNKARPHVLLLSSEGMQVVRQKLIDTLLAANFQVDGRYGFTPHLTLAYCDAYAPETLDVRRKMQEHVDAEVAWMCDSIVIGAGIEREEIKLGG